MRRSLAIALLVSLVSGGDLCAQILDETMVPPGQLRLQAHPSFTTWDSRFGRTSDGTMQREDLGIDLTDPTGASLFPGIPALVQALEDATSSTGYAPVLGSIQGRVTQDVTRIEFGGHLGVFDWLTIGVVVPRVQTHTALDQSFTPDTIGGADLGTSPTLTNAAAVDGYLQALGNAASAGEANASAVCGGGPSAACTTAQALATRATGLLGSAEGAYGASPYFPMTGSAMAASLAQVSSTLDADLLAAGLTGIGLPMAFATEVLTTESFGLLPVTAGAGIEGTPLSSRTGLWHAGDIEVSALVRLLERVPTGPAGERTGPSYRLTAGFIARLPTGMQEDPDIFLDVGTGDRQTDLQGHATAALGFGRFDLAVGGRYAVQRATTLTKRVAPLELAMPPISTRQLVRWRPASYLGLEVVPSLRLTDELSLAVEYRFFHKGRDVYELLDPALPLDPNDLALETGMKLHQIGAGLRYTTVRKWAAGIAPKPIELHLRVINTAAGSGGHTPISTRIEAGIRLFKRFWGPRPSG